MKMAMTMAMTDATLIPLFLRLSWFASVFLFLVPPLISFVILAPFGWGA